MVASGWAISCKVVNNLIMQSIITMKNITRELSRLLIVLTKYTENDCQVVPLIEKNMIFFIKFLQETVMKTRVILL